MHFVPQGIPNCLATFILLAFGIYSWSKREAPFTLPFAGLMLLGAFWGMCSTFELASETLAEKVFWNRFLLLPPTFIVVILFWIVLKLRGALLWLRPRYFFIFLIEPAVIFVLTLSGWCDRLFLSGISLSYAGPVPTLVTVAGPMYWMHIAYTYALLTCSFVLFASWARDTQSRFRSQSSSIVVAMAVPGLISALSDIGLSPLPGIDLTPASLVVSGALASVAIFRFRLADIIPIASRLIVQTIEDLTLVVDAKGLLVDFNPSAQAAIGLDPQLSVGRALAELPSPWCSVLGPYSGVSSAHDTIHVELAAGVRWYHLTVSSLREESGTTVGRLFHLHDITERKRVEEALRESQERIARAQKMEAIGRLAGGIAHDFNNMLQVLLGYCAMMKSHLNDQDAMLNEVETIEDCVKRAASLTRQLLAFTRKQVVQPKAINIGELLQQSERMLSSVLGEDVSLKVVLGVGIGRVRADPDQIQQVIMNLVLNARDAMPDGGRIIISIENVSLLESSGSEIPPGDYLRLTVDDTGRGMDANTMDHLFEPFFTTKAVGQGTGLGLPIVYGIVKQCGGYIKVESKISVGSTFTIHLPRVFEPKS
jgi:PAS domain S-box-containing protein